MAMMLKPNMLRVKQDSSLMILWMFPYMKLRGKKDIELRRKVPGMRGEKRGEDKDKS